MEPDNDHSSQGIYTEEILNECFSLAYIQSFAQNSFSYIANAICNNCDMNPQKPNSMEVE